MTMSSFTEIFARGSRAFLPLIALVAGVSPSVQAAPPKAPSKPVVTSSLVIPEGKTVAESTGTGRFYKIQWEDNSLDESGFRIEVRYGNSGPFLYVDSVLPNVTQHVFVNDFTANMLAQFRVVAFKNNGKNIESSESPFYEEITTPAVANLTSPLNFTYEEVNDGVLRFSWNDRSTNEKYFQIFYKKSSETADKFVTLGGLHWFDSKEKVATKVTALVQHGLPPGGSYNFAIRATREEGTAYSGAPTAANSIPVNGYRAGGTTSDTTYIVPHLARPTNITGEALNETDIRLRWKDNSYNETGYEVYFRRPGSTTWETPLTMGRNSTSLTLSVGPGGTLEWRVRAVATGSTLTPRDPEDYSTTHTITMGSLKPAEGLTASTSGVYGTVDLEWADTSEHETHYDIYTRIKGGSSESWYHSKRMLADTTRASITQYTSGSEVKPLELDVEYEFQIVALYANVGTESEASNIASAVARHGFTSRTYQPAKVGVPFEYEVKVSNNDSRQSWSVTGLPEGLTFDEASGKITGTPTESGVFQCPMLVNYLSSSATVPLILRIPKPDATPTVAGPIDNVTLGTSTQVFVNVEGKFADADTEKAVRLKTNRGDIDLLLYPSLTPEAINNFMGYVNNGAYNGVVFHRSVPSLHILQGGAYVPIQSPNEFASLIKRPASRNEPGISNIRGTVAHAKVGDNPDSATHDFFFNLADNSSTEGFALDDNNGGFTVFARVAGDGINVVDGIAALPIGQYKDFSGSTYDANLDRRVILDGSPTSFTEIPMNVSEPTAPPNMDITKTVQIISAKEVSPFKYEIHANSNPAVARPSIVDGKVLVEGLSAGTTTITVRAKDLDNNPVDQNFTATVLQGHKLAEIKRQPISVAVAPGKKTALTVTAAGSDLQYQWEKKQGDAWVELAGLTGNVLSIAAATEDDVGEYRLQVWNISSRVTSDSARIDLFTQPQILTHPVKKVAEVGKPLVLEASANGAPAPVLTWLRGGKAVAKQKAAKLEIPAATLKDAGIYTLRASNNSGRVDSNPANVIVVDKGNPLMLTLSEKTVVLKAQAAGVNLKYQWRHQKTGASNAVDVVDDGTRISGSTTATLTIKQFGATLNDIGLYTCVVTDLMDSELTGETGPWRVGVAGVKPVLNINPTDPNNPFRPDAGYVGIEYDYTLPGGGNENTTIASYTIAGLPPGLKVETTTGRITGKPTRAGEYSLKLTAKNPKGTTVVDKIPMYVLPMPEAVLGTFIGQIASSPVFNNNKGGRVDMTVTEAGMISGKLSQGKEVLNFTGRMVQTPGSVYTSGTATVTRKGKTPLTLTLTAVAPSGYTISGNVAGTISDGTDVVAFGAYRNAYNANKGQRSPFIGRHHLRLSLPSNFVGEESVPQGHSFAVVTLDANGGMKAVGKMADGTSLTASSSLGGQQQFLIYQALYKNTGSVVGQAYLYYQDTVGPNTARTNRFRVDGSVNWTREPQASANERSYKAGFGPVPLTALGLTYVKPGPNELVMNLPKARRNASLDFEEGGLEDAGINPDLSAISLGFTPLVPNDVANDAKVTLKMVAATGLFNGGFQLAPPGGVKRTAKYFGLIVPQIPDIAATTNSAAIPGADALGAGYFTLMQLPSEGPPATTLKNSPILSGSVSLKPVPITITQQPVAVTVNPGQEINLSVVASTTAGSQLKYQWRLNGNAISGATSSTYRIPSANEVHEGEYDVVIKTDYSTVFSQTAMVTVNDGVSKVVIARTPATNPVLEGTMVTYTATAEGTGPFTYKWYKGGTEIVPAEGQPADYGKTATLVIDSATPASAGVYNVRVYSEITPAGVQPNNANELTVANPISAVVAIRTPEGESLSIGAAVNFTLNVSGSVGPFTYQWFRNGQEIGNATSASYAIDRVFPVHAGVYKVKVSNAITPEGVMSNEVPLEVSTTVANVLVSRAPSTDTVALNAKVIFSIYVEGASPFTFQWSRKELNSNTWVDIPDGNGSSYTIMNAKESDQGRYRVFITNDSTPEGVMSNEVPLLVLLPVSTVDINLQPNTLNPPLGQPFSLHAAPNSVGPYSYQWFKDNAPIPGAVEATYTITTPSESDSGSYHVAVGNAANSDQLVPSGERLINFIVPPSETDPDPDPEP